MTLSVVINTKNSSATLKSALESASFADEIIVVDMQSTDDTVKIAQKFTKHIFTHKDTDYVEPARNFAIKKASSDWIFVLDADEEISSGLKKIITKTLHDQEGQLPTADAYYVPRQNFIFDKWIIDTGWWPDLVLRLFRNGFVEWPETIHAVPVTRGIVKEISSDPLLAIIHHNYQSVDQFISRMNRYTDIQSQDYARDHGSRFYPEELFSRFSSEFLRRYFAQKGVNEGMHGLSLSLLQAISESTVLMKAWEKSGFIKTSTDPKVLYSTFTQFKKELTYWLADWRVSQSRGLSKIWWQIRRKLFF